MNDLFEVYEAVHPNIGCDTPAAIKTYRRLSLQGYWHHFPVISFEVVFKSQNLKQTFANLFLIEL